MGGKKLYKSETNKKLAGVCAGVADYFEIDPTIVRVIWFVVTWFYGIGLVLYIAAALILPTESEAKAQMARDAARPAPDVNVEPSAPAYTAPAQAEDVHFDVKEAQEEPAPAQESAQESTVVEFNVDETAE